MCGQGVNTEEIICSNEECEENVDPRRYALGYPTCMYCGSSEPKRTIAIPYNKGAYQLIDRDMVKDIGK